MSVDKGVYSSVAQKEGSGESTFQEPPKGIGARHVQVLILFISVSVVFFLRAHLSVTMVAMTTTRGCESSKASKGNDTGIYSRIGSEIRVLHNDSAVGNETNCEVDEDLKSWSVYRTYKWDKPTQEMIMFSFFLGYTTMMMPMGIIAQRFGGKIPIMVALCSNGVLSCVMPWVPLIGGWPGMCICRLVQGMTQAAMYPSIHTILGKWAPVGERGRLSTYVYTGSQCGTVVAFQLAGLFAGSPALGWPSIFWLGGLLSFICFGLLAWLGSTTPHEHPTISSAELAYIAGDSSADVVSKKRRTPWKHIITSKPVWGIVVAHSGSAIGYIFVLTQIPLYMNKVLGVDIKRNGVYSSLPYIFMYFMMLLFGALGDFCLNRKLISLVNIRRICNSIGLGVSSLFLVAFSYVNSTMAGVTLLVLCLGMHSGIHVGFHINQIDLAPNFAGPVMAVGNALGNLSGLLVPVLVSNIIGNDVTNQHKWQIMFIVIACIQTATNFVFVALVRADTQPWNFYDDDRQGKEEVLMKEKNNKVIQNIDKSIHDDPL